jgi:transposase
MRACHCCASRHADDTTVPVLAKGKCRTGRLWTYVRDDRPFAGTAAPAAAFFYSADRGGVHADAHLATYAGLMQADAYAGFNRLYEAGRKPGRSSKRCAGRMRGASSSIWRGSTRRRSRSRRSNASMPSSRSSATSTASRRRSVRNDQSRPLATALETWLRKQRAKLSAKNEVAKAIAYSLNRWSGLTRFLDDGRLCMSNNAAERALRCVAVGRHNWTFAGSDEGGRRAAAIYTLIETAKLNDIDPRAWLADMLARLPDHPVRRIGELLPWHWQAQNAAAAA